MTIQSKILFTLLFTTVISTQALAKRPPGNGDRPEHPRFSSLDINEDGIINFDEFSSKEIPFGDHQTVFENIDSDGNGEISPEEFKNHKPPHQKSERKRT